MNIYMRYPDFKSKAVTFSFDDGTVQDKILIEIFAKYGIKATFNLNGTVFSDPTAMQHRVPWLKAEDVVALYRDTPHEIALHGLYHDRMEANPAPCELYNTLKERDILESNFKTVVRGMAYPYGGFNDTLCDALKAAGVVYGRTTDNTHSFRIPTEDNDAWWLRWHPTCHHQDEKVFDLANEFVKQSVRAYPPLFYLWGHSTELDRENGTENLERLCRILSEDREIHFATNIEIYDTFKAYYRLQYSADAKRVYNPSARDVYIVAGGKNYVLKAGRCTELD